MATRSMIARPEGDGWRGRYVHFDGYPEGVGRELWAIAHGQFKGREAELVTLLLDAHPAGWSSISSDYDWSLAPGFRIGGDSTGGAPVCYCHGERAEGALEVGFGLFADRFGERAGCQWAYIVADDFTVTVMRWAHGRGVVQDGPDGRVYTDGDARWVFAGRFSLLSEICPEVAA